MFLCQITGVTCILMQDRLGENRTLQALTVCISLITEMIENISSN